MGLVQASQHPFHLRHEPHVRHAVGFVEHQGLQPLHRHLPAIPEVDEAAGSGDDHIDTLAQFGHLAVQVGSSVHGHGVQAEFAGQGRQHPVDLDGELTGRQEHERERPSRPARRAVALRLTRRFDVLEERHSESEGLPRPGLGLAADVAARQGVGHREGLNGKGAHDAFISERLDQFQGDTERLEVLDVS